MSSLAIKERLATCVSPKLNKNLGYVKKKMQRDEDESNVQGGVEEEDYDHASRDSNVANHFFCYLLQNQQVEEVENDAIEEVEC